MARIIKRKDATTTSEHGVSHFTEYAFGSKSLSMGISEINGSYPSSGFDADSGLEQMWYVLEGEGTVEIADGSTFMLNVGDIIHIWLGEKYKINGHLRLVVASSPAWTVEQHKHAE